MTSVTTGIGHLSLDLPSSQPYRNVIVSPVVLFSILDHHLRRGADRHSVIGALLGRVDGDQVLVSSCFTVPHTEDEQVSLNVDVLRGMSKLHSEVYPLDQIVGWYSTGSIRDSTNLIHDFFSREMNDAAVLLVIDPTLGLQSGGDPLQGMSAFFAQPIQLGEQGVLQQQYRPIDVSLASTTPERLVVQELSSQIGVKSLPPPLQDLDALEKSLVTLLEMLATVGEYVSKASKGGPSDPAIGRALEETLSLLPRGAKEAAKLQQLWTRGLQDALMAAYLATLTRTHLHLAEHLRDFVPAHRADDS
jgi:translation initiation factor 3 subunit F